MTVPQAPPCQAPGSPVRIGGRATLPVALLAVLTLAVAAFLLAFALVVGAGGRRLTVGQPAPTFELVTFEGRTIRLADLRGSVVVLNFWASWCRSCPQEARDLEQLWQDYRDRGVMVLGVDYVDTPAAALAYLKRHGISYPNGLDRGGRMVHLYRVTGVPETLVVDAGGRLAPLPVAGAPPPGVARLIGPLAPDGPLSAGELRSVIDGLLAAGGSP